MAKPKQRKKKIRAKREEDDFEIQELTSEETETVAGGMCDATSCNTTGCGACSAGCEDQPGA